MGNLLLGMYAAVLAADGAKEGGENGRFTSAVLLAACVFFNILPPLYAGAGIYVSVGGILLICLAFFAAFYRMDIGRKIFTTFLAVVLGIAFFLVQKAVFGVEMSAPDAQNLTIYAFFAAAVCALSSTPKDAFAVSVISTNTSALLFYLQFGNGYIIGGGDTFQICAVLVAVSSIIVRYLQKTAQKLYPDARLIMREMARRTA